jgi:hypothetical protein
MILRLSRKQEGKEMRENGWLARKQERNEKRGNTREKKKSQAYQGGKSSILASQTQTLRGTARNAKRNTNGEGSIVKREKARQTTLRSASKYRRRQSTTCPCSTRKTRVTKC